MDNYIIQKYIENEVDLNPNVVTKAKKSRDNLLKNFANLGRDGAFDFMGSNEQYFTGHFGSFARKTQCQQLDDIDLMIILRANGAIYTEYKWDDIEIHINEMYADELQKSCCDENGMLNSSRVLNRFKKTVKNIAFYTKSDIHRNGEAVTLNLTSYEWSFDIVPAFHTVKDVYNRDYYIIPNGKGGWKKTDPRIDKHYIIRIKNKYGNYALQLIRFIKKLNEIYGKKIQSYLLESYIIKYLLSSDCKLVYRYYHDTINILNYIMNNIGNDFEDLKGIQGNINNIDNRDACCDYLKDILKNFYVDIYYDIMDDLGLCSMMKN